MDYNTENEKLSREAESPSQRDAGAELGSVARQAARRDAPFRQGGQDGGKRAASEEARPSYWAVLPAAIRYDPEIPASAKLLYAEISALTDQRGYCWASNAYFEQLYALSERTIVRLIRALEKAGYIRILEAGGGAARRKISAGINPLANPSTADAVPLPLGKGGSAETPDKNVSTPRQKCQGGGDKNVRENNRENKKENDPPKAPQGAAWEPEMFERFWKLYPRRVDKAKAIRAWDKLKADRKLMQTMSAALKAQMATEEWQRDNGRAIPYPSTWLNNRRWEDELSPTGSAGAPFRQGGQGGGQDGPAPSERRDVLWI